MKKKVLCVLSILSMLFSCLGFSACGGGESEDLGSNSIKPNLEPSHQCTFTNYIADETTLCGAKGTETAKCDHNGCNLTNVRARSEYTANAIFEMAKDTVGEIVTYDKSGKELALGTGFVYSKDGKILTNYHVIDKAYSIKITINSFTYNISSVAAYDKTIDLAVLQTSTTGTFLPLSICQDNHVVGANIYAFGSSQGLTSTFSRGVITYNDRELDGVHYVQHDAAISSGNSGGPLINGYGEIIGINTMAYRDSQNLNFAISVSEILNLKFGTPLTMEQFYEKECDVFTKVKNYVIQNGSYDSSDKDYTLTLGYTYSSDYSSKYTRMISYDVADDELCLMFFIGADNLVSIYIDEIDGIYNWAYIDKYDYYMSGTLYATTFTSNHLLGYSYNNISSSSMRTTVRELASSMANLLILYTNTDFSEIGVTASDLGFINY